MYFHGLNLTFHDNVSAQGPSIVFDHGTDRNINILILHFLLQKKGKEIVDHEWCYIIPGWVDLSCMLLTPRQKRKSISDEAR